ncbi:hypothetical protein JXA40_02515 [bacterium]|nr:hypothetical protein [candidate division CSSED10-310 bacterium]
MDRNGLKHTALTGLLIPVVLLWTAFPVYSETVRVAVPEVSGYCLEDFDGGQVLTLPGYGRGNIPGEPQLPARIFAVAIPPGARVDSVDVRSSETEVLPGTFIIAPKPVPRPLSGEESKRELEAKQTFIARQKEIYSQDELFPGRIGAIVRTAGFRKYNLVDVRISPVQYRPQSGVLIRHTGIIMDVHYTPGIFPVNPSVLTDWQQRMERRAEQMILNYQQAQQWYPEVAPQRGLYEFVIITTEDLESSVSDLANWEIIKGKPSNVVTVEWISSTYAGVDLAQKMRNFLLEKYPSGEWGIEDVCMAGHYDDVPMRRIADDPDTDLYFAELSLPDNQSWDANSNGQYLDSGDSCDFYAEINVGRIPWSEPAIMQHICQKSVAYEMTDDPAFKKNILLLGSYFWSDTDNAVLMEAKVDQEWMSDWTMFRMYEKNTDYFSPYPCDMELLHENAVPEWSTGTYAFVNYAGHGSSVSCHILGIGQPAFIEHVDCSQLNDDYPSIVFADACSNSETTTSTSIGREMLKQGAVGFVGSTRIAYGCPGWSGPEDGSSQSLDYYFTTSVTSGEYSQGAALQRGLQEVYQMNGWNYPALEMCEWSLWGNPDLGVAFALSSDGTVMFDRMVYMLNDSAVITVRDLDLDENPGVPDTIDVEVSTTGGDLETLTLTETGGSTYVFENSITVQPGSPVTGNGMIEVSHGDDIQVIYIDADDGHGGVNVPKTAEADVDGVPPVISGVTVTNITEDSFTVEWTTDEESDSGVTYGEVSPDTTVSSGTMTTNHSIAVTDLEQCTVYYFYVESRDRAGNAAVDDNGGSYYSLETYILFVSLTADMDADPGWTYEGQWAWGQPAGLQGDPPSGYTGTNVVGYNLNGEYSGNMPVRYATTGSFDCTGMSAVYLGFWRWLGVESNTWDHASIQVSNDGGSSWSTVWENPGSSINDPDWTFVEYDISDWAAGHADVKLRWGMGPADGYIEYCGWNIDDVVISNAVPCNQSILTYQSHVIDDSAGNGDGEINGGETIALSVTLQNIGLEATGVEAVLSTTNPHVTITVSHAEFPDIPQSGVGTSLTDYVFEVSEDVSDGEVIPFELSWTCTGASGQTGFNDLIVAPGLEWYSSVVLDPVEGDGDGVLDPGETAQIMVTLFNRGHGTAHDVIADLTSSHPQYVTIDDGSADFPDMEGERYGTSIAPHFTVTADPATPDHTIVTFTLAITGQNYATEDTFVLEVTVSDFICRYAWDLDTDPGWTCENQWAWGVPLGQSGDPTSGYTGANVYGYNLAGNYPPFLPETFLTSEAIDCSMLSSVEVRFMRWLGVESAQWDHACFRVSNDGSTWYTIWSHTGETLLDTSWQNMSYDISDYADGQSAVYLRWVMGESDSYVEYFGWNLDDIEIWAESGNPVPTHTPVPPTATSMPPTATPVIPTATSMPPTATPVIPTATSAPPTDTPIPPTDTPIPPTDTPIPPTDTPVPPTDTPVPPTHTPVPPTATPVPPTSTPTPDPGMTLIIDDDYLEPGDIFHLHYYLYNPGVEMRTLDAYILLDVYGAYWCYPGWNHISMGLDYLPNVHMSAGATMHEDVFSFTWGDYNAGDYHELFFYGAVFDAGTFDIFGDFQMIEWGFE